MLRRDVVLLGRIVYESQPKYRLVVFGPEAGGRRTGSRWSYRLALIQ
ncbi:MAG TPA: hypothetical protein VML55_16330 [Planctomycetaceae bacterium]|nr:hypothetical protein [Planctomycetaceae bacterium]